MRLKNLKMRLAAHKMAVFNIAECTAKYCLCMNKYHSVCLDQCVNNTINIQIYEIYTKNSGIFANKAGQI